MTDEEKDLLSEFIHSSYYQVVIKLLEDSLIGLQKQDVLAVNLDGSEIRMNDLVAKKLQLQGAEKLIFNFKELKKQQKIE